MEPRKIDAILGDAPISLDLTDEPQDMNLTETADALCAAFPEPGALDDLETQLLSQSGQASLFAHVAVKLARSKQLLRSLKGPHHVSIVFAVYKERSRIQTRQENPLGEDFLIRKISQLEWLSSANADFTWDMSLVDDGDPEETGKLAEQILAKHGSADNVKVLYLDEAIRDQLPVTSPMTDSSQSQKGGSIAYGMWNAVQRERPNHAVIFTDADLSTHLGQVGLLVDKIFNDGFDAAIGSRREAKSVVVKQGVRNQRGKLFIYLWKQLVPNLHYIVDTQCGFKAFRADTVRAIIEDLGEKKFAFDIELLLKTELRRQDSIAKVPIAWIDSEAASTTTDLEPYLPMLKAVAAMYRKYLPPNANSTSFAEFIDALDQSQWARLVELVPDGIASAEPADFGSTQLVTSDELRALAQS